MKLWHGCSVFLLAMIASGAAQVVPVPGGGGNPTNATAGLGRGPVAAAVSPASPEALLAAAATNRMQPVVMAGVTVDARAPEGRGNAAEQIEVVGDTAVGRFAPHQAVFAANLNSRGALRVRMRDGVQLNTHVLGIFYYDPVSGQTAAISGLKDSGAEIEPGGRVVYRNAFAETRADVAYTYTQRSIEQDIVLREQLPDPAKFDLDFATVRLAVITEFLDAPVPRTLSTRIDLTPWNQLLGAAGPAEEVDETVIFDTMQIAAGRALTLGVTGEDLPVLKQWIHDANGSDYLIESTPLAMLAPQLDKLPPGKLHSSLRKALPLDQALLSLSRPAGSATGRSIRLAQAGGKTSPAVVLDFLLVSTPLLNLNFGSGTKTGRAALGQATNDFWNPYYLPYNYYGSVTNLYWSDGTRSGVGVTVQNAPGVWGNGSSDPMYNSYVYSYGGAVTITLTNLPANRYDFYVYGHEGVDYANDSYELLRAGTSLGYKGTTIWGSGWNSTNWQEGQQFVVFRNIAVTNQTIVISAYAGPNGYGFINGLQLVPSSAVPPVIVAISNLINVDLGSRPSQKAGFAAVGLTTNDVWNGFNFPGQTIATLTNLQQFDGTATATSLTVSNGAGTWGNGSADPMYDSFNYPYNGNSGDITMTISNLAAGDYSFYLYAHGAGDNANAVFDASVNGVSCGTRGTTIWGAGWNSTIWEEGQQYVVFRNVAVGTGQTVRLRARLGACSCGHTLVNGLQIVEQPWADRDDDGLPDGWELFWFGNLNQGPDDDPDGDGVNNYLEYLQGRNPRAGAVPDANGVIGLQVFTPLK